MDVHRNTLGKKLVSCLMSVVLAAGLVPAQALAEAADELRDSIVVLGDGLDDVISLGEDEPIVLGEPDAPGTPDTPGEPPAPDEPNMPAFAGEKTVGGVTVSVAAEEGTFPAGAKLSVKRATKKQQRAASEAVGEAREEGQHVAASYSFDIKVIDSATGEELQPADGRTVSVSFSLAQVADENLTTNVYHVKKDESKDGFSADQLGVTTTPATEDGGEATATVEADGFSIYTVEFTYGELQYVLPGDGSVPMLEVLATLGMVGEPETVEVSDESLFSASDSTGEWVVTAHKPFSTTEWMRVTINGVAYEIAVTDDSGDSDGFVDNCDDSYTIKTAAGWAAFASSVNSGTPYSGKTVRLNADIEVSSMVGESNRKFSGTFDGCGHKLTFNATAESENCAPFAYIDGATFKRLTVAGAISTGYKYAAGIAAHSYGDCAILSCRSSIAIASSISGDGTHAGFVAIQEGGTLTIMNCLFDGSITGSNTTNCGGFVGAKGSYGTVTVTDSLYAPAKLGTEETEPSDGCATFVRNGSAGTNCYYTRTLGDAQGKEARMVSGAASVTVTPNGTATECGVSGITAYENNQGLKRGDAFYAGQGDAVGLTLGYGGTVPEGYSVVYVPSAGTLGGTESPYTLTMPDEDVTISAVFGHKVTVSGDISNGSVTSNKPVAAEGDTVTLIVTPDNGNTYGLGGLHATYGGDQELELTQGTGEDADKWTFQMPNADVVVTAKFVEHLYEDGDTYTINTVAGWVEFCDLVSGGETFSGKTVNLGADVGTAENPVDRMAGDSDHDFTGIFDGQGHTLTVRYGSADSPIAEDNVAPFRNVGDGCTIKDLHVTGDIYPSAKYAGGLVGTQNGAVIIRDCHVSTVIHSYTGGDGTHGGIVGLNGSSDGSELTIEGCLFDGKLLTEGTTATTSCSGFVGWQNKTVSIKDSLYAPAALGNGEAEVSENSSKPNATFVRNGSANANCYYTRTLGTAQGKLAHTVSGGAGVTVTPSGTATEYDVSGITAYENQSLLNYYKYLTYDGTLYTGKENKVGLSLSHGDAPEGYSDFVGYSSSAVTLESQSNGIYTFTMPDEDVTINGFAPDHEHFSDDGNNTYTIHTAVGWNVFCDELTYHKKGYFEGKTVKLDSDIEVTRMAGGSYHDFTGTFDGQGHTLTVRYGSAEGPIAENKAAPFVNVESGCTIKDLHVTGDIYTSGKFAGGLVGEQYGSVAIENCRVSVAIHSYTPGDGTHGGIVGVDGNSEYAKLTIKGCLFDGKLLSEGETATTSCAGFMGYKRANGSVTIIDSLYAPAALVDGEAEPSESSATFVRKGSAGDNCYYTRTLGATENQGKQAHSISATEGVTLTPSGNATDTYNVSGIVAYATGISYGGTFYAGKDDAVSLTLDHGGAPEGYTHFVRYDAGAGTLGGTESPYTLTMPDEDVTVSAVYGYAVNVDSSISGGSVTSNVAVAAPGDTVTLTVNSDAGNAMTSLVVTYPNGGESATVETTPGLGGDSGKHTFTMPAGTVTVTATFAEGYNYIDYENGKAVTKCLVQGRDQYMLLDQSWLQENTTLSGWYVIVGNDAQTGNQLKVSGNAHLILCDDMRLYAKGGITVNNGNSLTIYAQSGDTGTLWAGDGDANKDSAGIGGGRITINGGTVVANGGNYENMYGGAGISGTLTVNGGTVVANGGNGGYTEMSGGAGISGTVTVNGGNVEATGNSNGSGISGTVTVNGGNVKATGNTNGAGIWGTVTVNGGNVEATGDLTDGYTGAGISGTVTVNGGNVKATGASYRAGIDGKVTVNGGTLEANASSADVAGISGNDGVTVNFTSAGDSLKASSYSCPVTVAKGKVVTDSKGALYAGTLSDEEKETIAGKKLVLSDAAYAIDVDVKGQGTVTPSTKAALPNVPITLDVSPAEGSVLVEGSLHVTYVSSGGTVDVQLSDGAEAYQYTFNMPDASVTVSASFGHTVTIDGGITGGRVRVTSNTESAVSGDPVPLDVTPDAGYVLDSVAYATAGSDAVPISADESGAYSFQMPDADVTVMATFKPINYKVRFDGNGATDGSMADQDFTYDKEQALTTCGFTRTHYDFEGWATTSDGDVAYTDGQTVSNLTAQKDETVTLYAKWARKTYRVDVTPTENMTLTSGELSQNVLGGDDMGNVTFTADEGYYFPTDYSVEAVSGITVTRVDYTTVTVTGTPMADATITLAAPTAKEREATPCATFEADGTESGKLSNVNTGMKYSLDGGGTWTDITGSSVRIGSGVTAANDIKVYQSATDPNTRLDSDVQTIDITQPDAPTTVEKVDCDSTQTDDGRLIGVTSAMEYMGPGATSWTAGTGDHIVGLAPGIYQVRMRASGTALASLNQELEILPPILPPKVATPTFSPAGGTFNGPISVSISCDDQDATIYYRTDGTIPNEWENDKYVSPIQIDRTTEIKAFAVKEGVDRSDVAEATYVIDLGTSPIVSPITFEAVSEGYDPPDPVHVHVQNYADGNVTITSVELSGEYTNWLSLEKPGGDWNITLSLNEEQYLPYTVLPIDGLRAGTYEATIKVTYRQDNAQEDEVATANVSFTVNPRTYSVTFAAGEGASGEMDSVTVVCGEDYELPACGFTAPKGKAFRAWSVMVGDADPVAMAPGEKVELTADATVTAVWEDGPTFMSNTLLLSGQICVIFYVDLSPLTQAEREEATMEFEVGGRTSTDTYDPDCTNPSTHAYHGFTCRVGSAYMADDITATLRYARGGEEREVSQTYSAKRYVDSMLENPSDYSNNAVALVTAIADYGHYVQPFLAANNGWEIGKDHELMPGSAEYTEADVNAARTAVEGKAIKCVNDGLRVKAVTYSLNLASDTAIHIYMTMEDGFDSAVTATAGGEVLSCARQADGRWRIEIPGISAHRLGDTYDVVVEAGGKFTISVSALSYVNTVLNSTSDVFNNDVAHYAATSLYRYYEATTAFENNPNG